ncbi:MAG: hypothetical protein KDA78_19210, partial [Planctomycetaceae bacterium]|nr:hypothetical protein [Planctomycetaceae bacterium]
ASAYLHESPDLKLNTRQVGLIAGSLVIVSQLLLLSRNFLPEVLSTHFIEKYTMFPPTIPYVLGTLGWAMMLLAAGHHFLDGRNWSAASWTISTPMLFSRYAFTIYVLHHVVHLWPLWVYAVSHGQEPTYYWRQAMSLVPSLVLAVIYLVASYFLILWMQRRHVMGIEDSMRWICD